MLDLNSFDYLIFCAHHNAQKNHTPKYGTVTCCYEWLQTIIFIGSFYLMCTIFLVEGYQIPSSSMEPTFIGSYNPLVGDRIFALKAISKLFPPQRGDIVIFASAEDQNTFVVKRLVGLPGERILIRQGRIYINGRLLEDPPIFKYSSYYLPRHKDSKTKASISNWVTMYSKDFENGTPMPKFFPCFGQYYPPEDANRYPYLHIPEDCSYLIPKDSYFVMGDNSQFSKDSRFWGFLPKRNVFGKASMIWWPINRSEIFKSGEPTQSFLKAKSSQVTLWYDDE